MSTEQQSNPGARSETPITEQATTSNPTTTPKREKNPKRVAAGKLVAERTRLAREQQKKAAAEAAVIIANNNKAKNKAKAAASNPVPEPEPDPPTEEETPKSKEEKNSILNTTQWLAVGSIVVSLIGIYYKREELQALFSKSGGTPPPKDSNKVDGLQPVRLTVYEKNTPRATRQQSCQPRGVKHLD